MERTWVEIGTQVARRWKAFFARLEQLHSLNIDQAWHLWLLHFLFLDELNQDLKNLEEDWNHHPLSRFGHDKSPAVFCSSISMLNAHINVIRICAFLES